MAEFSHSAETFNNTMAELSHNVDTLNNALAELSPNVETFTNTMAELSPHIETFDNAKGYISRSCSTGAAPHRIAGMTYLSLINKKCHCMTFYISPFPKAQTTFQTAALHDAYITTIAFPDLSD